VRRFVLLYVVPSLLLLAFAVQPLITGSGTLILRDVLSSHYPLKAAQAESLRDGEIPLIDPYRAGGQPLLGNPNALPLYPTNLLYLFASPLWAMNAHFWIHLLLAPIAFFWLGRAWGLSRPAAWAAGVCYVASGFFLSLLNLYNLVAGAALAPAFIAAMLDFWRTPRRHLAIAVALLWTLLVLAGDPLFAVLSFALAAAAGCVRYRSWPARPIVLVTALGLGTAMAAPMWVEFLRILPLSFRGYWRYSVDAALVQSWDVRTVLEWFFPLFFGLPDFSFWGPDYYGGLPPLFFSLYPGLLAIALVAVAPWRDRTAAWAWGAVGVGGFLALGSWNPIVRGLYHLPGVSALRFPIKVWLLVAVGCALLCGLGFQRLGEDGGRRALARVLSFLAAVYFVVLLWLIFGDGAGTLQTLAPQRLVGGVLDHHWQRLVGLSILSLLVLLLLALSLWLGRRRPGLSGGLLVGVHLAFQLFFLQPLMTTDDSASYLELPQILAWVPESEHIVHGGGKDLFGPPVLPPGMPIPPFAELTRIHFSQLYPSSGIPWGRRYELNHSPEGLDSFFTIALVQAMKSMNDEARIRVLAASGVEVLLLDRPLLGAAVLRLVRERVSQATPLGKLYVYEISTHAASVQLATSVLRAPQMNAALKILTDRSFDPRTAVALPGEEATSVSAGGQATLISESAEEILVDVEALDETILLVQRTYHGIFRATVNGEPAEIMSGNVHRMAVEVPAGKARVRIWADRRPTRIAWAAALLSLVGLAFLGGPFPRRLGGR
jgi:hypothetical protein